MKGKPYEMKCMDLYENLCARFIDCPDVISKFFETSNIIDMHNQLHQDLLQLEKKWLTKNPYFHLGVNVTDTFLLANHHGIINNTRGSTDEKIQHPTFCWISGISTPTEC
jgi:hypothetical protein